jgi:hypothetical protein
MSNNADKANKPETKDKWDKWKIILEPAGGLLTAAAVGVLTFVTSRQLGKWQERENNSRVYTELMSKREEAETGLRKAMFDSIIGTFLKSSESTSSSNPKWLEDEVLKMELLAYNFHESLNLTPLFKNLEREIEARLHNDPQDWVPLSCLRRLRRVADDIVLKQFEALKDAQGATNWERFLSGKFEDKVDDTPKTRDLTVSASKSFPQPRMFGDVTHNVTVVVMKADEKTQELLVSLTVITPGSRNASETDATVTTTREFWISSFDFPMIDNTRLPNDQRCALMLRVLDNYPKKDPVTYELWGVCFLGSHAALKEKPYYDEVLEHLRQADSLP